MECAPAVECLPGNTLGTIASYDGVRSSKALSQKALRAPEEFKDADIAIPKYWIGLYGGELKGQVLRFRLAGNLDGPCVFALGGISAGRIVSDAGEGEQGWWREIARPGGGIDLDQYCVIGFDYPTGDETVDLCPEDFAELIAYGLKELGIEKLEAFVGASFGGMIGLAFARKYPALVERLCVISAAHRPHPMAQAWRIIQRRIIEFAEAQGAPAEGVALARELAMTTYRTPEEFAGRFSHQLGAADSVDGYLAARGGDYARTVSAARYLTLSAAIDRHDEKPEAIKTRTFVVGVDSDRLAPLSDVEDLERRLGGPSSLAVISSAYGHDAFLKESCALNAQLQSFFRQELS